jgi:hypothetical protein
MDVAISAKEEYAVASSTSQGVLPMTRRQKDPLRKLTNQERLWLVRISRSQALNLLPMSLALKPCWLWLMDEATPMRPELPVDALGKPSLV